VFCQIRLQPRARVRTKVAEDLGQLIDRYHPDWVFISDALLPYWSQAWKDSWQDLRVPFVGYIRADIKPDHLDWLIDRGMIGTGFGIESADETHRNMVLKKAISDDEIERTVRHLKARGAWFVPFFMTGTPGETFDHRVKTARMARTMSPYSITWAYEEL
jgi:radical SAM superfamily enzyme YgiQ (UPF0313 family)